MRPDKFVVQYKIGDEKLSKIKTFTNASAGKK